MKDIEKFKASLEAVFPKCKDASLERKVLQAVEKLFKRGSLYLFFTKRV